MSYMGITFLFIAASDSTDMLKGYMVLAMLAAVVADIFASVGFNDRRMLTGLAHHLTELTLAA